MLLFHVIIYAAIGGGMEMEMKKEFDHEKIKTAVRMLIEAVGDDPERPGLIETPDRVARM